MFRTGSLEPSNRVPLRRAISVLQPRIWHLHRSPLTRNWSTIRWPLGQNLRWWSSPRCCKNWVEVALSGTRVMKFIFLTIKKYTPLPDVLCDWFHRRLNWCYPYFILSVYVELLCYIFPKWYINEMLKELPKNFNWRSNCVFYSVNSRHSD